MVLGLTVAAIWAYLLAARGGFWRMREERPEGAVPSPAPSVTAVIPARNEAETVGLAAGSLARQKYSGTFRIVVVDDDSSDGTAGIARAAAPPELLTVVRAATLAGRLDREAVGRRAGRPAVPAGLLPADRRRYRASSGQRGGAGSPRRGRRLRPGLLHGHAALRDRGRARAGSGLCFLLLHAVSARVDPQPPPAHGRGGRRMHAGAPRRPGTDRRHRAHPRRADRRLRPGPRHQALGRPRVAGAELRHPQHPAATRPSARSSA